MNAIHPKTLTEAKIQKSFRWQAINVYLYFFFWNNSENTKFEQFKPILENV